MPVDTGNFSIPKARGKTGGKKKRTGEIFTYIGYGYKLLRWFRVGHHWCLGMQSRHECTRAQNKIF